MQLCNNYSREKKLLHVSVHAYRIIFLLFLLKWQWNTYQLLFPKWNQFMNHLAQAHWQQGTMCSVGNITDIPLCLMVGPILYFVIEPCVWWILYFFTLAAPGKMILSLFLCWLGSRLAGPPFHRFDRFITSIFTPVLDKVHVNILEDSLPALPSNLCQLISTYSEFKIFEIGR